MDPAGPDHVGDAVGQGFGEASSRAQPAQANTCSSIRASSVSVSSPAQ